MAHTKCCNTLLHIGDNLLCCFVFFPSMVLYWRGIWDLWGVYIFPGQHPKQQWMLLTISLTSVFGYIIAPLLDKYLDRHNKPLYVVVSRAYNYIFAALYMGFWRAVWDIADFYLAKDIISGVVNLVYAYVPLLLFRASHCCIFPPMFTSLDTRDDFLQVSTRFKAKPFTALYLADVMFSHVILLGLTVLTWRGLWYFLGAFIFPGDPTFSTFFCIGLGYGLILLIFLLEESLASVTMWMEKQGFYYKLVWEDLIYTVILFCTGILWRGFWIFTATYIFPDPLVGGWFCFGLGTFLLTVFQLFSYVCTHGVVVDGSDSGRDAIFPTKYLRIYLDKSQPLEPDDKYDKEKSDSQSSTVKEETTVISLDVKEDIS